MKLPCDVLVVGGGTAGVPAAVAAARAGAHTVMVEANPFPGGTGVAGLHQFVCGLYANGGPEPSAPLNEGLVQEIAERLGSRKPVRMGRVFVLPYAPRGLMSVFLDLVRAERQLRFIPNARAVSAERDGHRFTAVEAMSADGEIRIEPRVVVDCSGNGTVLKLGHVGVVEAPVHEWQMAGFTIHVKGLEGRDDMLSITVPHALGKAVRDGGLPEHLRFTSFSTGEEPDEGYLKLSVPPERAGEQEAAMEDALQVRHLLAGALPSFKHAYVVQASQVMHREGPRLAGEYTLTEKDVLAAHKFPDGVVKNAWPIELWDREKGPSLRYLADGEHYDVPLRCLRTPDVANLLCAGRCISVTREALGSTRVMGTCMALGAAAGREAARLVP